MSEIVLGDEARRAVSRWTRDDFYVHIRPVTSTYFRPNDPHRLHWNVTVEFRHMDYKRWISSGPDLEACILELAETIPKRQKLQKGYVSAGKHGRPSHLGMIAPSGPLYSNKAIEDVAEEMREKKSSKKKRKKSRA